jgi:hypothetical protein
MVEHVEGFLHFVFNFVIDGVNRCFTGDSAEIEDEHLKVIKQKFALKINQKTELIEVCLTVLTIISWHFPQNKGLQVLYD